VRFLVCTQPILGHVEPGLVIAEGLRARGHEVAWYSGSCVRARVEAKGHRFFGVRRAFDYDGADPDAFFPARTGLSGMADLRFIVKNVFTAGMPLQAADLEDILAEFPADALVADFVTFGPRVLSERGGPPWAAYGFSALSLSSADTAPYGLGLAPSATPLGRVRNRALNWLVKRVVLRDLVRAHDAERARLGLAAVDAGPTDTPLSPFLYLQGSVPQIEYPRRDLPPQVHFVGALTPAPRAGAFEPPPWWGELGKKKVVLVTQGTMDNKDLGELVRPTLAALADEDVLVVATTGRPVAGDELGPLPANARVATFVPYHELLPHVDVMVSNGGYNGVLIALANGVPLVVNGAQSDKPEICARVRWSGAGLHLRRVTPAGLRAAVRRVLGEPSFRARARALAASFQRHDGAARSAELLERLAETRRPVLRDRPG
jgi:MGT family glycosyltransferase